MPAMSTDCCSGKEMPGKSLRVDDKRSEGSSLEFLEVAEWIPGRQLRHHYDPQFVRINLGSPGMVKMGEAKEKVRAGTAWGWCQNVSETGARYFLWRHFLRLFVIFDVDGGRPRRPRLRPASKVPGSGLDPLVKICFQTVPRTERHIRIHSTRTLAVP